MSSQRIMKTQNTQKKKRKRGREEISGRKGALWQRGYKQIILTRDKKMKDSEIEIKESETQGKISICGELFP